MGAMTFTTPTLLAADLQFGEGPRYHAGRLLIADQHAREVVAYDLKGRRETITIVPEGPSGMGFLPDETLLIVSMHDRKVMALRDGRLVQHADLSHIATGHCNDMVVDPQGRAYVGNFGFDMDAGADFAPAALALVHPDGRVEQVADGLAFPNGMVITPDGRTLILAETYGARLTAFDIAPDGTLSGKRLWAQLKYPADGICLDAEGCVWVANPVAPGGFHRVREGGEVLTTIDSDGLLAIACMLGGPARTTLFMVEAGTFDPAKTTQGNSRIRMAEVGVAGVGCPLHSP